LIRVPAVVAAGNTMNEIVEAVKRVTDIMLELPLRPTSRAGVLCR
jgi:hypothetical protein